MAMEKVAQRQLLRRRARDVRELTLHSEHLEV